MGRTKENVEETTEETKAEETAKQIVEDAKKAAESMIEAAKKEIQEMFKTAAANSNAEVLNEETPAGLPDYIKEMQKDLQSEVEMTLFKDGDKYKDDKFISVNGTHRYQIQRGVGVKVPRYIEAINESSIAQDNLTVSLMEKKQEEAEKRFESINVTL